MNEAERRAASEKYYQKLRAELDERIRSDKQLQKIAEKIANKTADFNDTAKYSEIVSNYIGAVLQENVGEITSPVAKEFVCKELLRDQHSTINELFESVQVSIDEQNGIHIKTQKPKFPEERVDKVAHALEDPTVPLKTIKRRANAPVANVSKSFHDDCVKKNAQFRHDAGLKCYIVRIGTKCCEWCSEVAGKYEFGDQPDGIFRRHDNCDCTIIYDGQVLRGKQNADGSRSKTWEELPNANAADYTPPSLSEEQGRAIEQRNLAQVRGLNRSKEIDIFNENDAPSNADFIGKDIINNLEQSSIGKEVIRYASTMDESIDLNYSLVPLDCNGRKIYGDEVGGLITIYMRNCENAERAARTIIHECTHKRYGIGQSQWAECVCFAQELKHKYRRDYLTTSELRRIIKAVKDGYPEYNWRKGGMIYGRRKNHI